MKELPEPSRVENAGQQQDRLLAFQKVSDIPARYRNHPRFNEMINDPAHNGDYPRKVLCEAMSALEAEMSGKVKGPVSRGDTSYIDFYDGEGYPFDVKTPPSPKPGDKWEFSAYSVADTILEQLDKTHPNKFTKKEEPVAVLLDTTFLTNRDLLELRRELRRRTKEDRSVLKRVFEVNVKLDSVRENSEKLRKSTLSTEQLMALRQRSGR